jgi:hypothetical protein
LLERADVPIFNTGSLSPFCPTPGDPNSGCQCEATTSGSVKVWGHYAKTLDSTAFATGGALKFSLTVSCPAGTGSGYFFLDNFEFGLAA